MNERPNQSRTAFDASTLSNERCRMPASSNALMTNLWCAIADVCGSKQKRFLVFVGRAARDSSVRQATCQPIDTVVNVVPPEERDPTVFFFPSCVVMKQCGGCCAHTGTSCTPTEEEEKKVTLKKTKFMGGSKLQNQGEVTVTVKEHKKCRCQCKKSASDCNSLQKFISNQCRCECQNFGDQEACTKVSSLLFSLKLHHFISQPKQNPTKLFDNKSCSCLCRETKECTTGWEFDQDSCACQPVS